MSQNHSPFLNVLNTIILKSNLCGYNDAYILVTGDITVIAARATWVAFKNCAPFTKCKTKIDGTTIDDGEDLDLVMPMYNLIEYSSNYSETTGSLWFYSKDEATDFNADIVNDNNFKSFKYKAKLLGKTIALANNAANGILKNATFAVPLKYLKVVSATFLLLYFVFVKESTFETKNFSISLQKLFSFLR